MTKRFMPLASLCLLMAMAFTFFSCGGSDDDDDNGPVIEPKPVSITDFTPKSGLVGATVTITGVSFSTAAADNTVKFNSTVATVTEATATQLKVTVPASATTGKISVTVGTQTATSTESFTVLEPASVAITDFTPKSGYEGETVTITGQNFSTTAAQNVVKFNNTAATVTEATATQLKVTVPAGATTGKITVTVDGKTATTTEDFTALVPTITDFSPKTGSAGISIVIQGTNFSATAAQNSVKFNNTTAAVTGASATELTVTVPANVTTGKITVTVGGKTATSAADFVVLQPAITDFTPKVGADGLSVTITGTDFSATAAQNTVKFNSTTATITEASATQLKVTVPTGATTGKITVTVGSNTATSAEDFVVCSNTELVVSSATASLDGSAEISYSITIKNVGKLPLDLAQWFYQNYASVNDTREGGDPTAGSAILNAGGTLTTGQEYTVNSSISLPSAATYNYLLIFVKLQLGETVNECSTTNNELVVPISK